MLAANIVQLVQLQQQIVQQSKKYTNRTSCCDSHPISSDIYTCNILPKDDAIYCRVNYYN